MLGIRIPWTLSSEENWNRTHRVSSRLFIFCGLAMIANGFLDSKILLFFIMAVLIVIPYAYSFSYLKRNMMYTFGTCLCSCNKGIL
ncbi:MAG: SdpI family protein [[Clostridium] symbiosum]